MLLTASESVWIGQSSEVEAALNAIRADMDRHSHFRLDTPEKVLCFLGSSTEVLITGGTYYYRNGKRFKLVKLLQRKRPQQRPRIELGNDE
jgi:hypothetical protein